MASTTQSNIASQAVYKGESRRSQEVATRPIAGVLVPDTPLIARTIEYARLHSEPYLFNHVMRSWLFAVCIAEQRKTVHDAEVLAVATLLHDLGLGSEFSGPLRFEIEGANAARKFAQGEPVAVDAGGECVAGAGQADGVEVAAQQQPAAGVIVAAAHDDAGPAGGALDYFDAQASVPPPARDVGGYLRLAGAGRIEAGVDRVDADQGLEQVQGRH